MVHETLTTLDSKSVLAQARAFFAERVPNQAAYPEKQGPSWMTLRGQGFVYHVSERSGGW